MGFLELIVLVQARIRVNVFAAFIILSILKLMWMIIYSQRNVLSFDVGLRNIFNMKRYATKKFSNLCMSPIERHLRYQKNEEMFPLLEIIYSWGKFIIVEINGIVSLGQKWSPQIGKSGTVNCK